MKRCSISSLSYDQVVELLPAIHAVLRLRRHPNGTRETILAVSLKAQTWQELSGMSGECAGAGERAIYAIAMDDCQTAVLISGALVFRVDANGAPERIALYREPLDEEYWETTVLGVGDKSLVIYESGVMMFSEKLRVEWHSPKLYNEIFVSLERDVAWFETDAGVRWGIYIRTGVRVS
jgi:hypothetical protein